MIPKEIVDSAAFASIKQTSTKSKKAKSSVWLIIRIN